MAKLEDFNITWVARWGKNGHLYIWEKPSQETLDKLVDKYGVDIIEREGLGEFFGVWLQL